MKSPPWRQEAPISIQLVDNAHRRRSTTDALEKASTDEFTAIGSTISCSMHFSFSRFVLSRPLLGGDPRLHMLEPAVAGQGPIVPPERPPSTSVDMWFHVVTYSTFLLVSTSPYSSCRTLRTPCVSPLPYGSGDTVGDKSGHLHSVTNRASCCVFGAHGEWLFFSTGIANSYLTCPLQESNVSPHRNQR